MSMQQPLTFNRLELVKLLQQRLDDREAEREAARAKKAEELDAIANRLTLGMSEHQQFIVALAAHVISAFELDPGDDTFAEKLSKHYKFDVEPVEADASLRKLIRAYESAADEQVNVSISDTAFQYI